MGRLYTGLGQSRHSGTRRGLNESRVSLCMARCWWRVFGTRSSRRPMSPGTRRMMLTIYNISATSVRYHTATNRIARHLNHQNTCNCNERQWASKRCSSVTSNIITLVVFFKGLGRSGLLQVVFYCFRNESFAFFNRSGKARVNPKAFRVESA